MIGIIGVMLNSWPSSSNHDRVMLFPSEPGSARNVRYLVRAEPGQIDTLYTELDTFLPVLINNGDSITLGLGTGATADGRRARMPISNGNQPSAGMDTNGVTALLNSMSKLDPGIHAGAVHNFKLSRRTLMENRAEAEAMLAGYFAAGGTQLMVTVTDREELERLVRRTEELLAEQAVILPLFARLWIGAVWLDEVGGYVPNSTIAGDTWNIERWFRADRPDSGEGSG